MADARVLDFTNVKESGGGEFRTVRQTAGDYEGRVTKVVTVAKKNKPKEQQWLFTIKAGAGIYPYYCGLEENVLWKIRGLFTACGVHIPSKKLNVDPHRIVGKALGVTLQDDEYDGRLKSVVFSVFPMSEFGDESSDGQGDDDEEKDEGGVVVDDDEEEDETPPPPKKKKKKKVKPKVSDEELEELDIEDI